MTTPAPQPGRILTGAGESFRRTQTLEQGEKRLRLNFAGESPFAFDWDVATGRITTSAEVAHLFGIEEVTDITGDYLLSKVLADDRESLVAAFAGLTSQRSHNDISYRIVHRDRGVIWMGTSVRAMFDSEGKMLRISGTVTDSAATRPGGLEIAAAADWLRLAMAAGKSVGWDWDVKSGRDA